ncbi:MAG: CBS domain-containing protein [bacterium]|nr:CBS domain-containing protein [bacterium]
MRNVKVKDLMTVNPCVISPGATLVEAARMMNDNDCGMLPVGTADNLEGIVTDRDIVLRGVAQGADLTRETVSGVMTGAVCACNEDDYLEDAALKMRANKVSRLIVRNLAGKMVGILSFGGLLRREADAIEICSVVKHACGI